MPGRPGHYATRDGRVFDGELELEWRYPKPGAAPFVHFRREPERALRCRLKRSSTVRRVVAATFGVWPPPRTGSPPRDMHVASVDGTHHLDALVWVTPGDARRISAAVAGDGIAVEDRSLVPRSGRNREPMRLVVPASGLPDAWDRLARRCGHDRAPRPAVE